MTYSNQTETAELNTIIQEMKSKLSKYMNYLMQDGNQSACEAYKAYLIDATKKGPEQIISDACTELQFLINSTEIFNDLTQYTRAKKSCSSTVEAICFLIKELTGEELLSTDTLDSYKTELNNISARLAKKGISPTWLVSHGLASEQETVRFQESTNITGITYKKIKTGVRIDAVESGGGIVIPEFIDGLPVVKISERVFYKRKDISSVILPRHLTEIGEEAFSESSIVSITIPNSVETIGMYAFNNCRKLQSVVLPKGMKAIKHSTFSGCSALTSLKIPVNVTSIGDYAFTRCGKLKKIQIPDTVIRFGYGVFSSNPTIYCNKDSRAARYVGENYLPSYRPYEMFDKEK